MHMWESKLAYRKTRKGVDAYMGDKPQMCYQEIGLAHSNEHEICHSYHQTRWGTTNNTYDT